MSTQATKWTYLLICGCVLAFTIGCASSKKTHILKIDTIPPKAKLIVDGAPPSITPAEITLPLDGKDHYLFIKKEGCEEVRKVLTHDQYPENLAIRLNCRE